MFRKLHPFIHAMLALEAAMMLYVIRLGLELYKVLIFIVIMFWIEAFIALPLHGKWLHKHCKKDSCDNCNDWHCLRGTEGAFWTVGRK